MIAMAQSEAIHVDLEALQAQINLSMSLTEELVSSWVRPTNKNSSQPGLSSGNPEKELQEYLRRPPRLGVGAPLPESFAVIEREQSKLKHKLITKEKKRRRGDGEADLPKQDEEEGDSTERKGSSSTMSKRVRLDPFAMPTGKKKKHASTPLANAEEIMNLEVSGDQNTPNHTDSNGMIKVSTVQNGMHTTGLLENGHSEHTEDVASEKPYTSLSLKRKKKRKKTTATSQPETSNAIVPSVASQTISESDNVEIEYQEWTGFGGADEEESEQNATNTNSRDVIISNMHVNSPTPSPTTRQSLYLQIPRTASDPPLLNLNGPPPDMDGPAMNHAETSQKSKKKRRRNKKKHPKVDEEPQSQIS